MEIGFIIKILVGLLINFFAILAIFYSFKDGKDAFIGSFILNLLNLSFVIAFIIASITAGWDNYNLYFILIPILSFGTLIGR